MQSPPFGEVSESLGAPEVESAAWQASGRRRAEDGLARLGQLLDRAPTTMQREVRRWAWCLLLVVPWLSPIVLGSFTADGAAVLAAISLVIVGLALLDRRGQGWTFQDLAAAIVLQPLLAIAVILLAVLVGPAATLVASILAVLVIAVGLILRNAWNLPAWSAPAGRQALLAGVWLFALAVIVPTAILAGRS